MIFCIEPVLLGAILCLAGCWLLREPKPKKPVELDSYQVAQAVARKDRKS